MHGGGGGTSPGGVKKARIEIIPLIDVIFFLLATFVLFTLSLNKSNGVKVVLPTAETGETRSKAETSGATDKMLQPVADDWLTDWNVVRADRAGMVFYHLLQCGNAHRFEA